MKRSFLNFNSHKSHFVYFAVLLVIIVITYANSLRNGFMVDDYHMFLENDARLQNINLFYHHFIPDKDKILGIENEEIDIYYRPFAHILPMIGRTLFDDNVVGYHVMNLILFYLCMIVFYYLIYTLFSNKRLATLTSLLYAVHPLNGLFINYITASVFAMQLLALSCSFILFWKASEHQKPITLIIYSLICFLLGLLCHETSLTLPLYLTASIIILKKKIEKRHVLALIPHFTLALCYFIFRLKYASLDSNIFSKIENANVNLLPLIATNIKLFFIYLTKYIHLDDIAISINMSLVTTNVLLWIGISLIPVLIVGYWIYKKDAVKIWCGTIFLLGFAPIFFGSGFQIDSAFAFEPHWMFFPSIGMFTIIAHYLYQLNNLLGKKCSYALIAIIVLIAMHYSHRMNSLWGDEVAYTEHWLGQATIEEKSSDQKSSFFCQAIALSRDNRYDEAEFAYLNSFQGNRYDSSIYVNLASIEQKRGNIHKALDYLLKAYEIDPKSSKVNNNLGSVYFKMGDYAKSDFYIRKAMKSNPYKLNPYINLSNLHLEKHEYLKALAVYQDAIKLFPKDRDLKLGELYTLLLLNETENAYHKIEKLLRKSYPSDFYIKMAKALIKVKVQRDVILDVFEKALRRDPKNIKIYEWLGSYLASIDQFEHAFQVWEEGLKLDGDHNKIKELIVTAMQIRAERIMCIKS